MINASLPTDKITIWRDTNAQVYWTLLCTSKWN